MPPSGFLSARKMRAQDAIGGLPPDGPAIFMHAVRPRRRAATHNLCTGSGPLRGDTNGWHVCQDVHNLPHFICLPRHIIRGMCVAGYGHVLALHNSIIACGDQARLDLDVPSGEIAETPDIGKNCSNT